MAFTLHPLLSTYPGASFFPNGNLTGPHLAQASGGDSGGYWAYVPWEIPSPQYQWGLPPALVALREGRGTGVYGHLITEGERELGVGPGVGPGIGGVGVGPGVGGMGPGVGVGVGGRGVPFNYGWPKYGPMPLKPELGGFVGKINPYGRSFPHGYYKTTY